MTDDTNASAEPVQLLSVTAALGTYDKPALVYWAANRVADEILTQLDHAIDVGRETLAELRADEGITEGQPTPRRLRDTAEAEAWRSLAMVRAIRQDRARARKELADSRFNPDVDEDGRRYEFSASGLGGKLHDVFDQWILHGKRPAVQHAELVPYMDRFDEWLQRHQPEPVMAEATGINLTRGYAGRLDLCAYIDYMDQGRALVMLDYKTTRRSWELQNGQQVPTSPYPEAALQLTAYSTFEQIVRWDQAVRLAKQTQAGGRWYWIEQGDLAVAQPMPEVVGGCIVHVTPEHCNSHEVMITDRMREGWLYLLEAARFRMSPNWNKMISPAKAAPWRPDLRMPGGRDEGQTELFTQLRDSVEGLRVIPGGGGS